MQHFHGESLSKLNLGHCGLREKSEERESVGVGWVVTISSAKC